MAAAVNTGESSRPQYGYRAPAASGMSKGGFLGRKGDGDLGARTLWLDMRDIAISVQTMRAVRDG